MYKIAAHSPEILTIPDPQSCSITYFFSACLIYAFYVDKMNKSTSVSITIGYSTKYLT